MVDRKDDVVVGVKSTAILFGKRDTVMIALLQIVFVVMLIITGGLFHLHSAYYISLLLVAILFIYQQWLIKGRDSSQCFAAFLNNHWVGFVIFLGIMLSYLQ